MTNLEELEKLTHELTIRDSDLIADYQLILDFFNNTDELICIISFSGLVLRVNEKFISSLGWPKDEICGNEFLKFIHPTDQDKINEEFKKLLNGDSNPIIVTNRYLTNNGEYVWLNWHICCSPKKIIFASGRLSNDTCAFCSKNNHVKIEQF